MKEMSLKSNFILSTLYQILTMITPLITAPYISRVLGPDGVGVYSYTSSLEYYFAMFAALGTAAYGTREIARFRYNEVMRSKLFWEIESLTIITTFISLTAWLIVIIFNNEYRLCYIALSLNIIAVLFDISWFYAGIEHFEHTVLQNSIFKILGVICIFIFVKKSDDIAKYIFIMGGTIFFGNFSMWIYLPRYVKKINISDFHLNRHFKETLIYFIPTIATSIYTVLDKTLIGWITHSSAQNGYYEQATKIVNMAKTVCFVALNTVMGSRISYLFMEERINEIKIRINQSIDYILFMGCGILFGLIGIASVFVPWFFGKGYNDVIYLLYLMSPMALVIGISNCLGSLYYTPAGFRAKSAKYLIIGSIVNLVLNCILIPIFESYGAAIASFVAETIITMLYMHYCDGYLTYNQLLKQGWKKLIAALIMLVIILSMNHFIESNGFAVIIDLIVGSGTYILILILLKDSIIEFGKKILFRKLKRERN